jgi:hypothetical protein
MDVQKHYDSVERFNDIAGNLTNVTVDKIAAQMKVVVEEINELKDAFENKDAVELLDGACDGFVTLMGLIQQMKRAGFKVDVALKRVCENNLEKFPDYLMDTEEHDIYKEKGWKVDFHMGYGCCVIKDQNLKVRKPVGFQSVVLDDLVPKDFFGGEA